MERELNEKKRLSMENEELHWKIRQSTDTVMSLSTIEGNVIGEIFLKYFPVSQMSK